MTAIDINDDKLALATTLGDKCRRFTPHDLRSTCRSHLGALGVDVLIAERCLNHSLGGLVAVYDKHDYLTERRRKGLEDDTGERACPFCRSDIPKEATRCAYCTSEVPAVDA